MKILSPQRISPEESCPYIEKELARHEFFLAQDLNEQELEYFLSRGFRKFGIYFFKPNCQSCKKCLPLRVKTLSFEPTKSQLRVLKKNKDLTVKYNSLVFREEIYQLFLKHSEIRFDQTKDKAGTREEFIQTHFTPSAPALLSEFYLNDKLIAVGFLDISDSGVSSVYFIYDPEYSKRSLGIFGALKEIEFAKETKRPYYYLGYYIEENPSMNYKNQFHPYETYDWSAQKWVDEVLKL